MRVHNEFALRRDAILQRKRRGEGRSEGWSGSRDFRHFSVSIGAARGLRSERESRVCPERRGRCMWDGGGGHLELERVATSFIYIARLALIPWKR
jgi:hypothetical protein